MLSVDKKILADIKCGCQIPFVDPIAHATDHVPSSLRTLLHKLTPFELIICIFTIDDNDRVKWCRKIAAFALFQLSGIKGIIIHVIGRLTRTEGRKSEMKMKKYFSVLLIVAMILIPSASAFAEEVDQTISPTAIGVGDTRENATSFILDGSNKAEYTLFLQSYSDKDWYQWTNTTDKTRLVRIQIQSTDHSTTSRLGIQYDYNNGYLSPLMYADTSGLTSNHLMDMVPVPPGSTIYMVLDAPDLYNLHQYKIHFLLFGMTI